MTPVAVYYRWSSDDQQDSPQRQTRDVTAYLPGKQYKVVATYTDEGKSASSNKDLDKREAFLRLLADAGKGTFKVVVCLNVARFARLDSIDGAFAKQTLRTHGIILDTVQEGVIDWSTPEGRWKDMALSEIAAAYSRTLSKETISGRMRLIQNKEWPNGEVPFGYDKVYTDGKDTHRIKRRQSFRKPRNWKRYLEPNKDEAEVVRVVYQKYATENVSLHGIARDLQAKSIPTPDGGRRNTKAVWCKATVRKILTCKAYVGIGSIGVATPTRPTKFARCTPTEMEGCCPTIIDRATFDAVQAKLKDIKENMRHYQPSRAGALSGFLLCAHCGCKLRKGNANASTLRRGRNDYVCPANRDDPAAGCKQWRVWEEETLPRVCDWLVEHIDFEVLQALQAKPDDERLDDEKLTETLIESIKKKLQKGSANFLLADPELVPALSEQLRQWRQELAEAESRLNMIRATRDGGDLARVKDWWDKIRASLVVVAEPEWNVLDSTPIESSGGPAIYAESREQTRPAVVAPLSVLREFFRQIDLKVGVRWTLNPEYRRGRGGPRKYVPTDFTIEACVSFMKGNLPSTATRRRSR